jgi:hypothetical protein
MSNIAIHNVDQIALHRIGRIEQVRALTPFQKPHDGDHWQLNRNGRKAQRVPTKEPREPWPAMSETNLLLTINGSGIAETSKSFRIPFPFVIRNLQFSRTVIPSGGTWAANVRITGHGSIWSQTGEAIALSSIAPNASQADSANIDVQHVEPDPGREVILSISAGLVISSFLSVRIQPLRQYLKEMNAI